MPEEAEERGVAHQLGAGQMAMVAVGGSIGTGLLLGSAGAPSKSPDRESSSASFWLH